MRQGLRWLIQWQRDFYKEALGDAATDPVKAYVFGDKNDKAKTFHFLQMLQRQQIDVYGLNSTIKADGNDFEKDGSYIVPANQSQYKVIKTIFEKTSKFKDSLFYDITSWTMPLAFGLPYAELGAAQFNMNLQSEKISPVVFPKQTVIGTKSNIGYIMQWDGLYAPAALYELQTNNVFTKVAGNKFSINVNGTSKNFNYGSIIIPSQLQTVSSDKILQLLNNAAAKYGVSIYSVQTGNVNTGSDLGSSKMLPLTKPEIAMIVGAGVNATDAGEVWYLLDQRMNIPASHLEVTMFNRIDINKYNSIVMVGGNYADLNKEKLKAWVQAGGTLILTEEAVTWAAQNSISDVKFKKAKSPGDSMERVTYVDKEQIDGAQQIAGAIFGADADLTHPLAYGYTQKTISLFKANKVFMEKSKNTYSTPFYYGSKPLQSGWVSKQNEDAIKNSAAVMVNTIGTGRIINIADNPNFRAFWLGSTKLFMNAIFFGRNIDAGSGRTGE